MAGTPLKNLRMFQKLCGEDALRHVILATTMWDDLMEGEEIGIRRQAQLESKYWKEMITAGSKTYRYQNSTESAWEILRQIADEQFTSLIQDELVTLKRKLGETSAGRTLHHDLEELLKEKREALQQLQKDKETYQREIDTFQRKKEKEAQVFDETWKATLYRVGERANGRLEQIVPEEGRDEMQEKKRAREALEATWRAEEKKLESSKGELDRSTRAIEKLHEKIATIITEANTLKVPFSKRLLLMLKLG